MISNDERLKHNSGFKKEDEYNQGEQRKIAMRSQMIKNLIILLAMISIVSAIRHLLAKKTITLIIIDIFHFVIQFAFYQFSSRKMQQTNKSFDLIIFFQQIIYMAFLIINVFCERSIKNDVCDLRTSSTISSSLEKTQNDDNDESYTDFLNFCDSDMGWYHIQGQLIYVYLQGQESFILAMVIIVVHFISGIACYEDYTGTHIFLFVISACFAFQKRSILDFTEQYQAIFEQTYQKYEFWQQFVYRYIQNDIFVVQLTPSSSQTTQSESNECFDLKHLDAHSGLSGVVQQEKDKGKQLNKKPSISYKCTQYQQNQVNNSSSLSFPFMNLSIQQKSTFRDDFLKSLTWYLNKYVFRKFRRKESPVLLNPHRSLHESRIHFKNPSKMNGQNNSQNINYYNNNNNYTNSNNYNYNLNEQNLNLNNNYNLNQPNNLNSRMYTNPNIQITSHINTNQHEDTIQFDSHPIHFSSFNHYTTQNKNNSNQCLYLLQNSSMQHIHQDHITKSNLKNTNNNVNGRGSIHNPILKRNTIQTHFNLQNCNTSERKNSLLFQGSNSPQFLNPNQLETAFKSNDQSKNKGEGISSKKETQEGIYKKDNQAESPLKDMEGETLLSIVKKNLIEHQLFEQNQIDKVMEQLNSKNRFFSMMRENRKPIIKESRLGEQSVYTFEKNNYINDGLGENYSPQYFQVNCIECMYNGKHSMLVMMEEIKNNHSHLHSTHINTENRLMCSPPSQNNNSDNLKIKTFKQKIISSLAHELKTPLNSIISQVNQMLQNKNEEQIILKSHEFQILKSNANLLNYKIEDLLNYSMYLQGENKMNIEKFSIQEIMNEMIEIFKPQAKLKQLYFHSKISLLQPSIKKSLELKNEKNPSPVVELNQEKEEEVQNNPTFNLDNPNLKDIQFCPVSDFKKKFVSLKFMSEKVINTPVSEMYSNVSVPSSQQQQEKQNQPSLNQNQNNNDQFQQSSRNTISSPLRQPDVFVRSDKKKLICILINLLTNALKFTFKGGVSFTVNQLDKYTFEFSVTDTGIGIGEKLVKKMNNTNIEDYDTIFMNDQEDSFDDQEVSEELEDSINQKEQKGDINNNNNTNTANNPNVISQLSNIKGIEVEKKSEGEEDTAKKGNRASIFQQESKQQQFQNQHNIKRILDIKDICSISSSHNISHDEDAASELDKDNPNVKEESDKQRCSISLLAAQDTQKKFNLSLFSNNIQLKHNSQYKSQPSLYNFQRNCGIGIKLVKILSSQLSSDKANLKIKSKEDQGSTFTFILQDLQQSKVSLSQFIINDKNASKKNINNDLLCKPNQDYFLSNPYKDEIILSDDSIESHHEIKSQSIIQKTNTNRSCTSIAEFVDDIADNNGFSTPQQNQNENYRKSIYKKNKSDLDYLANQNLLNQNSLKLQILLSNKKILIVDDMPFNIEILKNYLKGVENLEIKEAFNGRSAIEQVKNEKFDLILMDINMPIMDGLEATGKITNLIKSHEINPVPVIIISAYNATQDIQNSFQSGAAGYVSKPISLTSLISEIYKVMSTI